MIQNTFNFNDNFQKNENPNSRVIVSTLKKQTQNDQESGYKNHENKILTTNILPKSDPFLNNIH